MANTTCANEMEKEIRSGYIDHPPSIHVGDGEEMYGGLTNKMTLPNNYSNRIPVVNTSTLIYIHSEGRHPAPHPKSPQRKVRVKYQARETSWAVKVTPSRSISHQNGAEQHSRDNFDPSFKRSRQKAGTLRDVLVRLNKTRHGLTNLLDAIALPIARPTTYSQRKYQTSVVGFEGMGRGKCIEPSSIQ